MKNPSKRPGKNPKNLPQKPGQPVQNPPEEGTEEGEIESRPQQQAEGDIKPHPAAPKGHATEKQRAAGPKPEEKVQGLLEHPPGEGEPEAAEQVIEQPHRQPHGQAEGQGGDLLLERDAHPRKSRPRKLPWRGSASS